MTPKALKFRIGLFITLAAALFVGSLFFFGLAGFFQQKTRFVSFFDESVRGLNAGSAVRFRGVAIGEVRAIRLSLGKEATGRGIPVIYEIDTSRLQDKLGVPVDISTPENYANALHDGLTAKLSSESLVTGQLYIDLDFRPSSKKADPWTVNGDLLFIPSTPSLLADVTDQLVKIVQDVSQVDFASIGKNLNNLMVDIDKTLADIDAEKTSENLNATLVSVRGLIDSGDFQAMTKQFSQTGAAFEKLVDDLRTGKGEVGRPLAGAITEMAEATRSANAMAASLTGLIEGATGPVTEIEETLIEFRRATEALQSFIEFLRRHPNALIFGQEQP